MKTYSQQSIKQFYWVRLHIAIAVLSTVRMEFILVQDKFRWLLTLFLLLLLMLQIDIDAQSAKPVTNRIDPSNWRPSLSDPMLLVHGRNLNEAQLGLTGRGISVVRTQSSAVGRYVFSVAQHDNAETEEP